MKTYVIKGVRGFVIDGPYASGKDAIEALRCDPAADSYGYVLLTNATEADALALECLVRVSGAFDPGDPER